MNSNYNGKPATDAVPHVDGGSAPAPFAANKAMSSAKAAINAGSPSAELLAAIAAAAPSRSPVADTAAKAIDGGAAPGA